MVKAILWDMDGVIADSGEAHFLAWQTLFEEHGRHMTHQEFKDTFGMANIPILRRCLGEEIPIEELRSWAARKEHLFRSLVPGHVRLLPGVQDWLQRGRAREYHQVVASSGEMANIVTVLAELGIGNYFDAVVSGAFLPFSKPDPAIFLQAAASVGATPAQSLVIEDGLVGIEAAKRASMRCLAVTTTHPAQKLAGADLIVDDLTELDDDALERLLS